MKEQLSRLINSHKRIDTLDKPKKKSMSVTLWKYTGRSIVKTIETYMSDLKNDLDIVFKPVKKFTKKHLKGVDSSTLFESGQSSQSTDQRGTHTLHAGYQEKPAKEPEFINWFDVDNEVTKRNHVQNTKCTYTDNMGILYL